MRHNYFIDFLRILMCMEVIFLHFWHVGTDGFLAYPFRLLMHCAVPTFSIISFYLSSRWLINPEQCHAKLLSRLWKLYQPMLFWGLLYFVVYQIIQSRLQLNTQFGFSDLLWQLTTGHSFNRPLWFLSALIVNTLLFGMLTLLLPVRIRRVAMWLLGMIGLWAFITEYPLSVFASLPEELSIPLARGIEMWAFATIGIEISQISCPIWLSKLISSSIILKNIADCPPLLNGVKSVASHSLNIYCCHVLVATALHQVIFPKLHLTTDTLLMCFTTFLIALLFSVIIRKIISMIRSSYK